MGEGKGSTLVHLLVVVLSLVAFGFAIAAERRRSVVSPFFTSFSTFQLFSAQIARTELLIFSTFHLSLVVAFWLSDGLSSQGNKAFLIGQNEITISISRYCMSLITFYNGYLLDHENMALPTQKTPHEMAEVNRHICHVCLVVYGTLFEWNRLGYIASFNRIRCSNCPAPASYNCWGTIVKDDISNTTYCVYNSDVATGYGVGAFLFLLSGESLLMGVTKCMCFGRPLAPGSDRAWSIIYFVSSWLPVVYVCGFVLICIAEYRGQGLTFLVAEACLIAGATRNAYHTKYRGMIYAQNFSCETLRKGVFVAGAVFVVATMILNVYYYMYVTKATTAAPAHKANRASSTIGMTGYA
ncbi:hypothetical protein QUC31_014378 [Theobroma cacao]